MSKKEKRFNRIKNNPKAVTFEELAKLLESFGFVVTNKSGGSHYTVIHGLYDIFDINTRNTIPKKNGNMKVAYVKNAIEWIERVIEIEKN